jgi:hypothetical protein
MVQFQSPAAQFDAVIKSVSGLTQQEIVKTAKSLHADVMRTPPKPAGFKRHVDGVEAPEEAVKVGGVIVYDYNRIDLIAKVALQILRDFSPVLSGKYRDSHRIVSETTDEIRISNTVEYARVIEIGKRGSVKLRINNGGRVYERTMRRLKSNPETSRAAKISFAYTESAGRSFANSREGKRAAQWPTLIITAL